jgi:hypothetical protein
MSNISLEPMKLTRADGKSVDVAFYNNFDIETVEILDIKHLKFVGKKTKDITKSDIRDVVFKGEEKLYLQNKKSKIVAGLSKKHLNKIISTVFTKDTEGKYGYLKKEIVSNVDTIFYAAIPILKHPEIKKQALYHNQIIHRLAIPLKIGGLTFLVMITVKERIDYKEMSIDEFSIYDLYSEAQENEKPFGSPSTVSKRTFRSQYQMVNYSINDLINFVKMSMTKIQ